ncbi:MAG: hypothetical protein D3923_16550, partial [Candidatus Electrothrix sp. AR3]|nr:hypothetical protein [Candidatus Electrothrix sp. AR3]
LGRKETAELTGESLDEEITAMAEMPICGGMIAEQGKTFACKGGGRGSNKLFNAYGYHVKRSRINE